MHGWVDLAGQAVDEAIQASPIDTRRALYGNVVLSGGSTMLKNFGRRLCAELSLITAGRLQPGAKTIDVTVQSHALQQHAAWFGGSLVACDPSFKDVVKTRAQYEEHGPSVCRSNAHLARDL